MGTKEYRAMIIINNEVIKKVLGKICPSVINCRSMGYLSQNRKDMISFCDDKKYLSLANQNKELRVLITKAEYIALINNKNVILIESEHPKHDFVMLWNFFARENYKLVPSRISASASIHSTAVIANENVIIGENVEIGPHVTVLRDVHIGANSKIDAGSVLGTAFIHKRTSHGLAKSFHDGKLIIGDNVEIHTNCSVDKGNTLNGDTIIGNNTKISHLCYIAHSSVIGCNCLLHGNLSVLGGARIGDRANINPGCTIGGWVTIGDDVTTIINSVVISDLPDNAKVSGHYALDSKQFMRKFKSFFGSPFER